MTAAAKRNFGTELWMGPAGGTLVKIAELLSVGAPKPSRGTIDATTHDSAAGAMEFITEGIYDPGEMAFSVNYIAGSAGDLALIAAAQDGELRDFKQVVKGASDTVDLTFSGYVTSYGPDEMPTTGKQEASGSIKVSGPVEQAASA